MLTSLGTVATFNWLHYVTKPILGKTDFNEDRKKIENDKIGKVHQFCKIDSVSEGRIMILFHSW